MDRLLEQVVDQDAKSRLELERLREEVVEVKMQVVMAEAKAQVAEAEAETERRIREEMAPSEAISGAQLSAIQARLEELHEARLLSEEEFFALEDLCADVVELRTVVGMLSSKEMAAFESAAKVRKLVGMSEQMASDAAFARQARRKFVSR